MSIRNIQNNYLRCSLVILVFIPIWLLVIIMELWKVSEEYFESIISAWKGRN